MAYDNNQSDPALPVGDDENRESYNFLPKYFRTNFNKKFLASTLDQLLQPGVAEKVNGFIGRRITKAYTSDDNYVGDVSLNRINYQLEPAVLIEDTIGNTVFYKDYMDYINQLKNFKVDVDDHNKLNEQEYYSWDPLIDWDKFVNFREYYWLPYGPQTIGILGQSADVETEIQVIARDNADNKGYVFFPDGLTQNPNIRLYRGQTYTFTINTPGKPFYIKTASRAGEDFIYNDGVSEQGVEEGSITFTVDNDTPDLLYYVDENDPNTYGLFIVLDIDENSFINVEDEILGKLNYTSGNNIKLSNGMKVEFKGKVTPEIYGESAYYVEGVGAGIKLIPEKDLEIPNQFAADQLIPFDTNAFDRLPFGNAASYPAEKDYITINKSAVDGNAWSKYNRWFHKSVIEQSAEINGQPADLNQDARAKRPIIEFKSGVKLYNFGVKEKPAVDLVDTFTTDVFSTIEGSAGYNIDGVDISEGMRILFTADTDILVKNKIFEVKFITQQNSENIVDRRQIALITVDDTDPVEGETVLVKQGDENRGAMWHYTSGVWYKGQQKTRVNQPPKFDLFDANGENLKDSTTYPSSDFTGVTIFEYAQGTGTADTELGFPLTYRTIENVGDITFNWTLPNQEVRYQDNTQLQSAVYKTSESYLKVYDETLDFSYHNGWAKGFRKSYQPVLRQYVVDSTQTNLFEIDMYDSAGVLSDLEVKVFVDNDFKQDRIDYDIENINNRLYVNFNTDLEVGQKVVFRTKSSAPCNGNGYYEVPKNLERNPQNNDFTTATLGSINDHLNTMIDDLPGFSGEIFGVNNVRDLGDIAKYGNRFVKHSNTLPLTMFHVTNKEYNIKKAIDFVGNEYAKFKRQFLTEAETLGFDAAPAEMVDRILQNLTRDKDPSMPFYFSQMAGFANAVTRDYEVVDVDSVFFALSQPFDIQEISPRAVYVYQNEIQLTYGKDYTFDSEGFCIVNTEKQLGDRIVIKEFESTDGSYIPPTPTKLGIFPKYEPKIYVDDTYLSNTKVIQGHDGSIIHAFDDYRDDLVLELELRIYNNIKQTYNERLFNIYDIISSSDRNTGVSKQQIDSVLIPDFIAWAKLAGNIDYSTNVIFNEFNSFTYNYSSMVDPNDNVLPGFWRSIYKNYLDTDRPHTHPWECLGFSIMPSWWEDEYGAAPYTSNNLLMWEDIEQGIIRAPGVPAEEIPKYARTNLTSYIPVDAQGNLLSPYNTGYAQGYVQKLAKAEWKFGDEAPAETAWRRSSHYRYSLLKAMLLNKPGELITKLFDLSRLKVNLADQIVHVDTEQPIKIQDLVFPNVYSDTARIATRGLVNFVSDYLNSDVVKSYEEYKTYCQNLDVKLGYKLGGYSDISKFNLVLDSRTPLNKGNVFVPQENYEIKFNTSSPIETITYSGVIIERTGAGYIVQGYDRTTSSFTVLEPITKTTDPTINVGGVTEEFIEWAEDQQYVAGLNVRYNSEYYRVKTQHVSEATFDIDKFAKLPFLPTVGGRDALFRRSFAERTLEVPYGTLFTEIQEVVDFLLGYQAYLELQGFAFDRFNDNLETVENWDLSVKEFLFWTTQEWGEGSLISLSPCASQIKFQKPYRIVDNIFDNFYDYSILDINGQPLDRRFISIARDGNEFTLTLKNTAAGIYSLQLPLVQKEHVLVLDSRTVFNDVLYNAELGYRQDRIFAIGYKSTSWDGSVNIPGFLYDEVVIQDWSPYTDYNVGDVVKYKEYYYISKFKNPGEETFNENEYIKLDEKPTSQLTTNLDYRTVQFADFYDLDTDNFDASQQKLAQHLIGYQKRDYLANIINDDVSQYKFYQGFIREKGTRNAFDKLFDVLGSSDKDSLEFYEEWAIKQGQYGVADGFEEVEYVLDESQFKAQPQAVEIVTLKPSNPLDLIYRVNDADTLVQPTNYNTAPFPTKYTQQEFSKTAGYVNMEDVDHSVYLYDDIINLNIDDVNVDNFIWVANKNNDWDVLKHVSTTIKISSIIADSTGMILNATRTVTGVSEGDVIGLYNAEDNDAFYKVVTVSNNVIIIDAEFAELETVNAFVSVFESVRLADYETIKTMQLTEEGNKFWIDSDSNGKWNVINQTKQFTELNKIENNAYYNSSTFENFGTSFDVDASNTWMAVGAPEDNKVYIYRRASDGANWFLSETLEPFSGFADTIDQFGISVAMSKDNQKLIVGAPKLSNAKSYYQGNFVETNQYTKNQIVTYKNTLWQAVRTIEPGLASQTFESFNFYENMAVQDSTALNLLIVGDNIFDGETTSHMLVVAPEDQYNGSKAGDRTVLRWNINSFINTFGYTPFAGAIPELETFVSGTHTIVDKIEQVIVVANTDNSVIAGDIVTSDTASGEVAYAREIFNSSIIYLKNVSGRFDETGRIDLANGLFVGEYAEQFRDVYNSTNGFWMINTPSYEIPTGDKIDEGKGLVFVDYLLDTDTRNAFDYYNILDKVADIGLQITLNDQASFLAQLTWEGDNNNLRRVYNNNFWTVRSDVDFASSKNIGDSFRIQVPGATNLPLARIDADYINDEHAIFDIWDGYIDFTFEEFDPETRDPFEPTPRYEYDSGSGTFVDNGSGTIVKDSTTGAEAEVMFYQRNFNDVRIYVKNVTGSWTDGGSYGEPSEIIYKDYVQAGALQPMGDIVGTSLANSNIGPLFVVRNPNEEFNLATVPTIVDGEYWFYDKTTVSGVPREPNIPSSNNNDWTQVYNIPLSDLGTTDQGYTDQGAYFVYEKSGTTFTLVGAYVVPETAQDLELGSSVKISINGDTTNIFVGARGGIGKLFFVKHTEELGYALDRDENYRGAFDSELFYRIGEIVVNSDTLYVAITNVSPGAFDANDWEEITTPVTYLGYLPSNAQVTIGDDTYYSIREDLDILRFADNFTVDTTGDVLVCAVSKQLTDSVTDETLVVYRKQDGKFILDQVIDADIADTRFGSSISLSPDGKTLFVGEPYNDVDKDEEGNVINTVANKGTVSVYELKDSGFDLTQRLISPNVEVDDQFGFKVHGLNDSVAVTSSRGDITLDTTFNVHSQLVEFSNLIYGTDYVLDKDSELSGQETLFDNGFTTFFKTNKNIGSVHVFEKVDTTYIPAQSLETDLEDMVGYGKEILFNNNHVYIANPTYTDSETYQGIVQDFRKERNSKCIEIIRSPIDMVDLEKIKGIFLYNTDTNQLIERLDFIDPIQGKIAGIADQNISYKVHYDPAVYSVGTTQVTVDELATWGERQVGQLWWNLSQGLWVNPYQGNTIYQTNTWNTLFEGTDVEVCEWVESNYLPSEWAELADTEEGLNEGISGQPKYGDEIYVQKSIFDSVSQTFSNKYYFWVSDKVIVPDLAPRTISCNEVENLIRNPHIQGYKFVSLLKDNKFIVHNCDGLLSDRDVAINFQYWTVDDTTRNIHSQYQIITEGLATSTPNRDIEQKWFDSLVGYDAYDRPVPDINLKAKQQYGVLNKPRQSMFVNKVEALKQLIERTNSTLKNYLIVDDYDLDRLFEKEAPPSISTNLYDLILDTEQELQFVGTARLKTAQLTPVIVEGSITRVDIVDPGRGYLVPPSYKVDGIGSGAVLEFELNSSGGIANVVVVSGGDKYTDETTVTLRNFSVLVNADSSARGRWTLSRWNFDLEEWEKITAQQYDTSQYWNYVDWYADTYSEFSKIDYIIDQSYELDFLESEVGDLVKINNVGTGGWLLLEQIDDQENVDYTVNFKTVGRQNGTIQFKNTLYDTAANKIGYDSDTFDLTFYDNLPITETRVILETLRDSIFVDELAIHYNELFFASVRYAFSEQNYIDWAFKSSFVKAKHNVGNLEQKINFENDNLENYEDFINEAKPFRTKVREFISSYESADTAQNFVSDFDLPPYYNESLRKITTRNFTYDNGTISSVSEGALSYPDLAWQENNKFQLVDIKIADSGNGYIQAPQVVFDVETTAKAVAYVSNGKVNAIEILDVGNGFTKTPVITIEGGLDEGGTAARAVAIIGDNVVRSARTVLKFDRIQGRYEINEIAETETFVGGTNTTVFTLKWPISYDVTAIDIKVNGVEVLQNNYTYYNKEDTSLGFTRQLGEIEFTTPPASGSEIVVSYNKDISVLSAADRIQHYYNPTTGQLGKDLPQLMTGVDYGGVEITSFSFAGAAGWMTELDGWYTSTWDDYDTTYEDEVFQLDGSTIRLQLSQPLENGVVYNVYKNGVRIDDENYGTQDQTNANALMPSLTGDGVTDYLDLDDYGISSASDDLFVVRKITSDGSITPDPTSYDTQLQGGDLNYSTATGLRAEDIIVDGDGIVTITNTSGPEEVVPGHVVDTLDIKVYDRPGDGSSKMYVYTFKVDPYTSVFTVDNLPANTASIFAKINDTVINTSDITLNMANSTVTLPESGNGIITGENLVSIVLMDQAGANIYDIDEFVAEEAVNNYITQVPFAEDLQVYVTVAGIPVNVTLVEADETFGDDQGRLVLRFDEPPFAGNIIRYSVFGAGDQSYSVVAEQLEVGDGNTVNFVLDNVPLYKSPVEQNMLVFVDNLALIADYNETFTVSSTREYVLRQYQQEPSTIVAENISVFLNDELLTKNIQYRWSSANSSIELSTGVGNTGDRLKVYVHTGEYTVNNGTIQFNTAPAQDAQIKIVTFTNHDLQNFDRFNLEVVSKITLDPSLTDYNEYRSLTNGLIKLSEAATDVQYVFVLVNGSRLTPNVDYTLTDDRQYLRIEKDLTENDVIDILQVRGTPISGKFGYRVFKDMLNRTHYKRLNDTYRYTLAQDLNWYDTAIELDSVEGLPEPNKAKNIPGVVFINGERIEYFVIQDNRLRQLRRGTLGTGIKELHEAGTRVYNQGVTETIPYKDETIVDTAENTGGTTYTVNFDISSIDELEVFVGGTRLRKYDINVYDYTVDQDSPAGDITLPAQYSVDTATNTVTLVDAPNANARIQFVKKTGKTFSLPGVSLRNSESEVARFIRSVEVDLP